MKHAISRWYVGAAFLAFSLAAQTGAQAGLTVYTTLADYQAATTGNTLIDFEGIAGSGSFEFLPIPPGITLSGVNFTIDRSTSDGNLFVIGPDFYYPGNSVLSSQQNTTGVNNILITLPGSVTAAAMDLGSFNGGTATITTSNGDTYSVNIPALPDLGFTGFTSTMAITSLEISSMQDTNEVLNLDNFRFGSASVPEPSSLALAFSGAFGVGLLVWRRRRLTA